jgi:hypothetical protein
MIAVGMALGAMPHFSAIDPIRARYWSAVVHGVVAAPVMITMMLSHRAATRSTVLDCEFCATHPGCASLSTRSSPMG